MFGLTERHVESLAGMSPAEVKDAIRDSLCSRGRSPAEVQQVYDLLAAGVRTNVRRMVTEVSAQRVHEARNEVREAGRSERGMTRLLSRIAEVPTPRDRELMLQTLGVDGTERLARDLRDPAIRSSLAAGRLPEGLASAAAETRQHLEGTLRSLQVAEEHARSVTLNPFVSQSSADAVFERLGVETGDTFVGRCASQALESAHREDLAEDIFTEALEVVGSLVSGGLAVDIADTGAGAALDAGSLQLIRAGHLAGTRSAADVDDALNDLHRGIARGVVGAAAGVAFEQAMQLIPERR